MIYISSSCVKNETIEQSVKELAEFGFKNIELSGGTNYREYSLIVKNLLNLKNEFNLNYLIHNYFPPPKKGFVLNLASLDKEINEMSFKHILNSIDMSALLGAKHLGFHAGFFLDISTREIGKKITSIRYDNIDEAKTIFYRNYNKIKTYALKKGVNIYIENNVYSSFNFKTYGEKIPLMLLSSDGYNEMNQQIDFNLLLDLAHLKVSCKTLKKDFNKEINYLFSKSNYIHLSENNGLEDSNKSFDKNSSIFKLLKSLDLKNKIITLEVYDDLEQISNSYNLIESLI